MAAFLIGQPDIALLALAASLLVENLARLVRIGAESSPSGRVSDDSQVEVLPQLAHGRPDIGTSR